MNLRLGMVTVAGVAAGLALWQTRRVQPEFPHARHERVFPTCESCHTVEADRVTMPAATMCTVCHNGSIQPQVEWQAPSRRPSNLQFNHAQVVAAKQAKLGMAFTCATCHQVSGGGRMDIQRVNANGCLGCHAAGKDHHVDAPCATCHVALTEATEFTAAEIAGFTKPADHTDQFLQTHGSAADESSTRCAVCHARDLCSSCHANAAEIPAIQALEPDPRVAGWAAENQSSLPLPASHREAGWWENHAEDVATSARSCAACHTQTSCRACHVDPVPDPIRELSAGQDPRPTRRVPPSHTATFADDHRALAASATSQCSVCHTQDQCTSCHLASAAVTRPGEDVGQYHPANFVQSHPAAAFGQEVECASCHNPEAFCRDCHTVQGLGSNGRIDTGFHNRKPAWVFGHGQAARQGLETCATCHAQRDCIQCHSALGGRRVNPHGPDFDPEKLREKSPVMCAACHPRSILNSGS